MNIRIGKFSQFITPSYSHCNKCGTTWAFVKPHILNYTPNNGMFPLCEKCWNESDTEEKNRYCINLLKMWNKATCENVVLVTKAIGK